MECDIHAWGGEVTPLHDIQTFWQSNQPLRTTVGPMHPLCMARHHQRHEARYGGEDFFKSEKLTETRCKIKSGQEETLV